MKRFGAEPARILVADDNPDDLALTCRFLQRAVPSVEIQTARDGLEALKALEAALVHGTAPFPHLIILDLKMPKLNGREVVERLRDVPNLPFVPIVLFTSSRLEADVVACYRSGARSFVHKPVDYDEYRLAVAEICRFWLQVNVLPSQSQDTPVVTGE